MEARERWWPVAPLAAPTPIEPRLDEPIGVDACLPGPGKVVDRTDDRADKILVSVNIFHLSCGVSIGSRGNGTIAAGQLIRPLTAS